MKVDQIALSSWELIFQSQELAEHHAQLVGSGFDRPENTISDGSLGYQLGHLLLRVRDDLRPRGFHEQVGLS